MPDILLFLFFFFIKDDGSNTDGKLGLYKLGVSVSNDGINHSEEGVLYVYDSSCVQCDKKKTDQPCMPQVC